MPTYLDANTALDLGDVERQLLIGTLISVAFWGMTCLQTYIYFSRYNDSWRLKSFVIVLNILDTLHKLLCVKSLWDSLITHFGVRSESPSWELVFQEVADATIGFLSRCFFTWRIWRFASMNWVLPFTLLMLPLILLPSSIGDFVSNLVWVSKIFGKSGENMMSKQTTKLLWIASTLMTFSDIAIAVVMCIILRKSRTGTRKTDRLIIRLMRYSVATGACTAAGGVVDIITTTSRPNQLFWCLGALPLPSVYFNAVLSNLNFRQELHSSTHGVTFGTLRGTLDIDTEPSTLTSKRLRRKRPKYSQLCVLLFPRLSILFHTHPFFNFPNLILFRHPHHVSPPTATVAKRRGKRIAQITASTFMRSAAVRTPKEPASGQEQRLAISAEIVDVTFLRQSRNHSNVTITRRKSHLA